MDCNKHCKPSAEQLAKRYGYYSVEGESKMRLLSDIRAEVMCVAVKLYSMTPCCSEQSRMLNALDEVMWLAIAAVERHKPEPCCEEK